MKYSSMFAGISLSMLTACASIVSKSDYPVTISSDPPGARVRIVRAGTGTAVDTGTTPFTVTLPASKGFFQGQSYELECSGPGMRARTVDLRFQLDPWYIGNLVFGGLLGILIVDPATGAMWKLPGEVFVDFNEAVTPPSPRVTRADDSIEFRELAEPERRDIYRAIIATNRSIEREVAWKFGPSDHREAAKFEDSRQAEERETMAARYDISVEQLDAIEAEGLEKDWPRE